MIAGLCNKKILAPIIFEGNCDTNVFESYVEQVLVKELRPGQVVVMDNIKFHKTKRVQHLIESAQCKILFLPTYSPDLNLIESYWFKIKNYIRKISHQFLNFFEAVQFGFKNVTSLSH
jgi:putative transposase